ncbi:unnamed protein product, partial [Ectocarpus sp. 12 AP-2014]
MYSQPPAGLSDGGSTAGMTGVGSPTVARVLAALLGVSATTLPPLLPAVVPESVRRETSAVVRAAESWVPSFLAFAARALVPATVRATAGTAMSKLVLPPPLLLPPPPASLLRIMISSRVGFFMIPVEPSTLFAASADAFRSAAYFAAVSSAADAAALVVRLLACGPAAAVVAELLACGPLALVVELPACELLASIAAAAAAVAAVAAVAAAVAAVPAVAGAGAAAAGVASVAVAAE